ncbi:MAG: gamma-glutamyl-gamma-aminobutyrate hydrolase family protein [Nitrososphaera sp.]
MLLVVDNGSVYTPSLLNCMNELHANYEHYTVSDLNMSSLDKYSAFILSGRRKNDPYMNAANSKIIKHALRKEEPLLGICYGAEILALTLGGTLQKMTSSRQGLYQIEIKNDNPLINGKIQVFESHSYMISKLDSSFKILASSSQCKFEFFCIENQNIFGTQFHPEMSQDGKTLLKNFISIQ